MVIPLCTNQFAIQDINQRKLQVRICCEPGKRNVGLFVKKILLTID